MKYSIIILISILLASSVFGQVISEFSTSVEERQAVLKWTTASEAGVKTFEIQRSFDGTRFYRVDNLSPLGHNSIYRWIDRDLFKSSVNVYYYRVIVHFSSGRTEVSNIETVTMNTSGINRTWGSIKAMFR